METPMAQNPFLSDEWLAAAKALADEAGGAGAMPAGVSLNIVVTGGPQGDREIHLADGSFATGLIDDAPTKLTVPYTVAKAMFLEGNQQAAMQAFMGGQIKVEGDMTKLMAMQGGGGGADQADIQAKLQAITSPD
jgi:hypothetical protein